MSRSDEPIPLKVLIVEDSPEDAEIVLWELRKAGFAPVSLRVDERQQMLDALQSEEWQIVLSDYVMPHFSGLEALELVKQGGHDMPFIIISGRVGEDIAVEAMRAGASDYLLKGNLSRLCAVIAREIGEADLRRESKRAERELYLLKKAVENLPLGLTITDLNHKILYINPTEAEMHGYSTDELIGESTHMLAPPETWQDVHLADISLDSIRRRESINLKKDGSTFPTYIISNLVTEDAAKVPIAMVTCCEDITERKNMEMTLRRQMAAIESSMDGIIIFDHSGHLTYVNQASAETYGYNQSADFMGQGWEMLLSADDVARLKSDVLPILADVGKWSGELTGRRRSGTVFPMEISITNVEDNGYVCVFRDISERKLSEERLRYLSTHDPLTGFYNRLYFEGEMDRLNHSRQYPISVIVADVDGLKRVNDSFGHTTGDELLRCAARAIASAFRNEDMVARIGGDEFVILLPDTDQEAVMRGVERIRKKVIEINTEEREFLLSLSLGFATTSKPGTLDEAVRIGDQHMYEDKLARRCGRDDGFVL